MTILTEEVLETDMIETVLKTILTGTVPMTVLTETVPVTVLTRTVPVTVGSKIVPKTVLNRTVLLTGEITLGQQAEIIIEEMKTEIDMHLTHGEILEIIAEAGVQAGVASSSGDLNLQDSSRTKEITELRAEIIP